MAWLGKQDGSLIAGYGPFTESAHPPADGGTAFYRQDFALTDPLPWKTPNRVEVTTLEEFNRRHAPSSPARFTWHAMDAVPFSGVFQEIMSSIRSGTFEKTVPVVLEMGSSSAPPAATIIGAMTRQSPPLHSYGWIQKDTGFAGATPELLFSLNGLHLSTMALAGTARSEDRDVFEVDEKEIREHEYVAQTLVSKLLDFGVLTRRSREILNLGSIVHFLTLIEVGLKSHQGPEELIRRLHPTPALGPLPRTDGTLNMLLEWRKRLDCPAEFGAPFGLWSEGRFDAVVAIRGMWWDGEKLRLPAGCGIIEASRLVNEWRELRLKRESVKRFLIP